MSRGCGTDGKVGNELLGSLWKIRIFALEINRWASEEPFISSVLFLLCVLGGKQKLDIVRQNILNAAIWDMRLSLAAI